MLYIELIRPLVNMLMHMPISELAPACDISGIVFTRLSSVAYACAKLPVILAKLYINIQYSDNNNLQLIHKFSSLVGALLGLDPGFGRIAAELKDGLYKNYTETVTSCFIGELSFFIGCLFGGHYKRYCHLAPAIG